MQKKAGKKRKESKPGILMAVNYRVCPIEMEKTGNDMREMRQRRWSVPCVEDCIPEIQHNAHKWQCNRAPSLIHLLKAMEEIMDKARSTAIQLQTDNPDGHWAIKLLDFYLDDWLVWLREFSREIDCFGEIIDEDVESAKERARLDLAEEIVKEIEKENENRLV